MKEITIKFALKHNMKMVGWIGKWRIFQSRNGTKYKVKEQ